MNDDNFFSINRLMEFGLGIAVAQQMTKTLNESMSNTNIPGSINHNQNPLGTKMLLNNYFIIFDGKQAGPFSEIELSNLILDKKITKDSFVWFAGMKNWQTIENTPEVLKIVALLPPVFNQPEVINEN